MHDDVTTAAHLTAIAQGGMGLGLPAGMLLDGSQAKERSEGRQLVRRAVRVASALARLTLKRSPKWARTLAVACLAIPGPFDEAIVWPALLVYVAIRNRAEFASVARGAWKGQAA